jgi:signal transduction histidine kinase
VRLAVLPDSMVLEVQDAGRGIAARDVARAAPASAVYGVGLAGMRERIRQMGGSFAVESTGAGTCIRAAVPRHELSEVRRA